MKSKKNILIGAVIVGLSFTSSSCTDYLDEERNFRDLQTEDRIFSQKDYSEQWLAYCYSRLLGDNMEIAHRKTSITNFSDDMIFNEGNNGEYYRSWKLGEYQYLKSDNTYQQSWSLSYDGIRQASILIHNIYKNQELSQSEIIDMKGQARFIRAYLYWLLLRKYGPIPIMPDKGADYSKTYDELSYPRNTYDECVDYIASEMQQAAKELPLKRPTTGVARATRGAALAVRAKVYLYGASPLANGNAEMSDFQNKDGNVLISQEYDEQKWAKAAAAARDVMELNLYSLYVASKKNSTDFAYPSTITPPENVLYSNKKFPDGWANIDPFESYRAVFNGDVLVSQNPELIFTRGTNQKDNNGNRQETLVSHQLPASCGGFNCHGLTMKQCDAYDMADGTPFERAASPAGFTSDNNKDQHKYDHLRNGVSMQYANREPRFYASVGFNGAVWSCTSAKDIQNQNRQIWYYRGQSDGRSNSSERWIPTGIGMMKFVNPSDCMMNDGSIVSKVEPTIRYADILLMYAEALNELKGTYQIASWDGAQIYDIKRDASEMRRGIKPVRMRAGVPDYDDAIYTDAIAFRTKLKHERQVELCAENQRYYDLRRWKDAPKEEGSQVYGCNAYMTKDHAEEFYVPVRVPYLQTAFSRKQYFWPITFSELERNKNMTQAPGWEDYE